MAIQTPTLTDTYKIRSYEVQPDGTAKMQTICNLLQETAGNHALALNYDISQLMEQNMTWVLFRLHVVMDRYPQWRDEVKVLTWPSRGDTLRAFRDFRIFDQDDNELGHALSYWMIIDLETRRPIRMPQGILELASDQAEHTMEIQNNRMKPPKEIDHEQNFHVRLSDLDVNRHVNNVKYVEWALEAVPANLNQNKKVKELDIQFQAESKYGDEILSGCTVADRSEDQAEVIHTVRRSSDEKVVSVARSVWG